MTNVSYAVAPSNASQEYFSNISTWAGGLSGRLSQTAKGAVLSLQWRVDNTVPLLYPVCVGRSHVFRKRPHGVAQTLSAAKREGAERLCDGCPCVGAEEICGVPSPNPCRSEDNTVPSAYPIQALPYRNEGKRRLPNQPASQARRSQTECPSQLKKYQIFNLRSHAQFCYREQVVLPACASSSPGAVPPHPRLVEPQAPLHAHHTERKN